METNYKENLAAIDSIFYNQTLKYTEKIYDTMDLSKFNGKNIVNTKYRPYYYFYRNWVPWEVNKTHKENIEIIKNETNLYFVLTSFRHGARKTYVKKDYFRPSVIKCLI